MARAAVVCIALAAARCATAFVAVDGGAAAARAATTARFAYVPDGMTAAQYAQLKAKEKKERETKNFGRGGARGFESRSMTSFQYALERGEIALKDVPYMQRGGSWDNKDLKGKKGWQQTNFGMRAFNDGNAKKLKENKYDKMYNKLAKDKNQLGNGRGKADWTTGYARWGPKSLEVKPSMSDEAMWRVAGAMSKKEIARQGGRAGAKLSSDELAKSQKKKNIFGW